MKNVKIITIILAIVLVTLVAFAGVYVQTQNRMENKVKDYSLSKELSGARIIDIKVSDGSEEESIEGTETAEETESIEGEEAENTEEQQEENTVNPEMLTVDNYRIIKNTIEKRLQKLGAQDYAISLNEADGTIRVELAENDATDTYAYFLTATNKTEIKEKDTENELIADSMIKKAKYHYASNMEGEYQVYLEIQLNKEGQAKIEELSSTYAFLEEEIDEINAETEAEKTEGEENTDETQTENPEIVDESAESNEEVATGENAEQEPTKKIAVLTIAGTEYDIAKIEKNKLTVKIGSETTNNTTINNNISKAAELALLIDSGKYPLTYEIENNRYVYSDITKNQIMNFTLICLVILFVALCAICIKYKTKGILVAISFIGFISTFSLLLRNANVMISIEGIGAIILVILINLKFNQSILSKIQKMDMVNEAINSTYKDVFLKLIPIMIITITFCFSGWENLISFGLIMFWGLVLIALYNIIVTKTLLKIREN